MEYSLYLDDVCVGNIWEWRSDAVYPESTTMLNLKYPKRETVHYITFMPKNIKEAEYWRSCLYEQYNKQHKVRIHNYGNNVVEFNASIIITDYIPTYLLDGRPIDIIKLNCYPVPENTSQKETPKQVNTYVDFANGKDYSVFLKPNETVVPISVVNTATKKKSIVTHVVERTRRIDLDM